MSETRVCLYMRLTKVLVCSLSIVCALKIQAQSTRFRVGLQAGPNLSKMSFYGSGKPRIAYIGGLSLQYKVKGRFSLSSGIYYEKKGEVRTVEYAHRDSINANWNSTDIVQNLTVFNIPLMFRYDHSGKSAFFVQAGPYLGLVNRYNYRTPEKYSDYWFATDRADLASGWEAGISIGAGIQHRIKYRWSMSAEAHLNQSTHMMWTKSHFGEFYRPGSLALIMGIHYDLGRIWRK